MKQTRSSQKNANQEIDTFIHASFLLDEMATIIPEARKCGLECIILKGAALHISGLLRDGNRPMTDIDLLIHEDDHRRWREFFASYDYEPLTSSTSSFIKHGPMSLIFDLHTTLRFLDLRCLEQAWRHQKPQIWADETFYLLPPEINVLYLSLHMTITHGYASRKWLNDLDTVIRYHLDRIDWEMLLELAHRNHVTAPLAATLHHLRRTRGTPVPVSILVSIDQNSPRLRQQLFSSSLSLPHGLPWFDYFAPFLIQASPCNLLLCGFAKLFPPPRFMKQRYNTTSTVTALMWYPIRLLRLGSKFGVSAMLALTVMSLKRLVRMLWNK